MALNRDKVSASAAKLLQSGKFDKAILELRKLVEDDPKDVRTLLKLGDTYVKLGARGDAITAYQAVSDVYAEQGFYLKAVAVYKQMLRVDASVAAIHLKLAEMYQQLGLANDSMQHYQQVAVLYEQQGRTADSLDVLKRMVDLDPENLPSRIKLAELFAKEGRLDEAINEFRSAASYLKDNQRFDDYVRVAERLVYFAPHATDVIIALSKTYLSRGDPRQALGKLQVAFKADPRNVDVLALIADAFLAMQQVAKTISVYKEIARIHESVGVSDQAQTHWQKVLQLVPDDQEAQQALGMVGTPAAPVVAAAPVEVPQADPEEELILRVLTETDVYLKYGLKDKALDHIQRVFALRPNDIEALTKLRDIHQAMGNRTGLVEALSRLVEQAGPTGDPRLETWRRELQALRGGTGASSASSSSAARQSEPMMLDPEIPDEEFLEPMSEEGLPPDEEIIGIDDGQLELADESIVDDELIDDGLLDDGLIEPDGFEEVAPDDELLLISGPSDEFEIPSSNGASSVPADVGLPPIEDGAMEAFGDEFVEDDDRAMLMPADDDGDFSDLASAAQAGLDSLTGFEGATSETFFDNEAFANAPAELDLPDELDANDEPPPDAFASTEIMSLSPQELAGLRAMASGPEPPSMIPSDEAPATEHRPGVASASLLMSGADTAFDDGDFDAAGALADDAGAALGDLDDFADATMASSVPAPSDFDAEFERELAAELKAGMQNAADGMFDDDLGIRGATDEIMSDLAMSAEPEMEQASANAFAAGFDDDDGQFATDSTFSAGELHDFTDEPAVTAREEALILDASISADDGDIASFSEPTGLQPIALASEEYSLMSEQNGAALDDIPPYATEFDAANIDDADPFAPVDTQSKRMPKLGVSQQARGFEDDPAAAFFPDELEEAEFFIQQELLDEAREILEEILENVPDSARVTHMLARVVARENGESEPPAPWEQKIIAEVEEEIGDFVGDLGDGMPADDGQVSLEEVLEQFKRGVREQIDENDADTHYNLGIAYREMGLIDEAVSEFEIAARAPSRAADAHHLTGLTWSDRGEHEKALTAFENALGSIDADGGEPAKKQRGVNEFQRGVCLEGLGNLGEALQAFRRAREMGAEVRGLAESIDRVTEKLVADGGENGVGHVPSAGGDGHRKKNIDYL